MARWIPWRRPDRSIRGQRDAFAATVRERLEGLGESRLIRYDRDAFCLRVVGPTGEEQQTIWLTNFYEEFVRIEPAQQAMELGKIVASIGEAQAPKPITFDAVAERLLPLVRARAGLELWRMQGLLESEGGRTWPSDIPHRLLSPALVAWLAIDGEHTMAWVTADDLARWGVGFETAFERAMVNLAAREAKPFIEHSPGLYRSDWADRYDTSRLLLPEAIAGLPLKGAAVAMPLHRDVLLVTGLDDTEGLRAMAQAGQSMLSEPRLISTSTLVLDAGTWRPFVPDANVAGQQGLSEIQEVQASIDYAEQKFLLDALHAKTGEEVYVATHAVRRDEKSGQFLGSFATWTSGVDTLLPRAQSIALVEFESGRMHLVPWDTVTSIAAELLEPTEHWPERFRVRRFPDAAQIEKLRAAAISSEQLSRPTTQLQRRMAAGLDVATLATLAWCFLAPGFHYPILISILAALPIIALLLLAFSRGAIRLDEKRGTLQADVAAPFFLPGFALMARALLDIELMDWTTAIVCAFVIAVLLVGFATIADRRVRQRPWFALLAALLVAAYGFGITVEANALLDASRPMVYRTQVMSKHVSYGSKANRYLVKVLPWGPRQEPEDVIVPRALYDTLGAGSAICIMLRSGRFGIPWFVATGCR